MSLLNNPSQRKDRSLLLILLGLGVIFLAVSIYFIQEYAFNRSDLRAIPASADYAAPNLALTDLAGRSVSLADYRGQVVLVNLWATWCPPCKEEMPALETFYRKHKQNGFTIVAINDGDAIEDVIPFVEEYGLSFPIWLDPTYIATEKAFKTINLPSSYVINREGQVVLRWVGGINYRNLDKYVSPVIEELP